MLPDGTVKHLRTIRHPVLNSAGEVVKLVGTSIDITEHKRGEEERETLRRLEAELAHANRLTTMGELTASIAHEVNQPLGAMVANAAACTRWLAAEPPETVKARRALDSIAADGRRASEIIGRIRALVKHQAPRKDLIDVNVKIAQVIELAADEIRRNGIVLRTELAEGLPRVQGDRVQLQQVLLNLILNAIDAMGPIQDRPREMTIVSRRDGADVSAGRGTRRGPRHRSGARGASVRAVLYDQAGRAGDRAVHQSLDRRGARRQAVGSAQRATGSDLPVLAPGRRGCFMSAKGRLVSKADEAEGRGKARGRVAARA